MISGVVTGDRQAVIHLTVRGPTGQEQEIEAIIDTGFDGCLSLPSSLIVFLSLAWRERGRALLADGSESVFDTTRVQCFGTGRLIGYRCMRPKRYPLSVCLCFKDMSLPSRSNVVETSP